MTVRTLTPECVDTIPEVLAEHILYVSIRYATVAHLCCCGCGHEVITPLTPTDWSLTFDGETVSLSPSIGNWSFDCRSHYWIRRNRVDWAPSWSTAQVDRARAQDRKAKAAHADERRTEDGGCRRKAGPAALRAFVAAVWRRIR